MPIPATPTSPLPASTRPLAPSWLARGLRRLFLRLVRLYYPRLRVEGGERLPGNGPVLLVANHPNGLLDPVVLQIALSRPVRFLAKSTFFANPFGRLAMAAFGSIPVYRSQDDGAPGAGRSGRNEETFALCRGVLRSGDWLALFPEGTSHSDARMRPLKTGAARIALSSVAEAAEAGAPIALAVVPAGLDYDRKSTFRSGVLVRLGEPLAVPLTRPDDRAAAAALTEEIAIGLGQVVLQAETRELLEGIARVAAWTAQGPAPAADPAHSHVRTRALLDRHERLRAENPDELERITRAARDYARVLGHVGITDPWALEMPESQPLRVVGALAKLALTAPFALVGAALSWLPYRLAGRVAARVAGRELDVLGTVKLLAGSLFLLVTWTAEALVAGLLFGPPGAAAILIAAPVTGYVALRFEEIAADAAVGLRYLWIRRARPDKVARLADRRRALAQAVARALDQA